MSATEDIRTSPQQWRGVDLGTRTVSYDERDAILYALAVGAEATELDLVFEKQLRVLPTFALTLAQWAPDELGSRGGFDTRTALHGSQSMEVIAPLPRRGAITMRASVGEVWDKGAAAVFEVKVESANFTATWAIFAPDAGGFGGERGPSKTVRPEQLPSSSTILPTSENQAALYRLTGDRHHIHIDPDAARAIGQPRPIMHGLCTLAASTLLLARRLGVHPADLSSLSGRFAAPLYPGDAPTMHCWDEADGATFELVRGGQPVIAGARARFTPSGQCSGRK